jgi:hypothetical protein
VIDGRPNCLDLCVHGREIAQLGRPYLNYIAMSMQSRIAFRLVGRFYSKRYRLFYQRQSPTPVANYQYVDHSNAPFSGCGASIFTIPNTVWCARIAISANTVHEGIDRSGNHLFPAFPYDHFTKVGDDDVATIYAFLMTREPVRVNAPPNTVPRPLLAAWTALYLHGGPFQPDPLRTAVWNRGAYLVEGPCHVNFGPTSRSPERLV